MSSLAVLSVDDLVDELAAHAAHMSAGMCRYLELVAECDRRGAACSGWGSTAEWLAWRCGLNPRSSREHVRVARALEVVPLIHAAFARGELSYAKVRALTRVRRPEQEEELLRLASVMTASQLDRALRAYRRVTTEEAHDEHDSEELTYYWNEDGSLVVRAQLAPEDGALFLKALETAREKLWQEQRSDAGQPPERGPAGPRRPTNVDALLAVADGSLAHEGDARQGADRFQVTIHAEQEALQEDGEGTCLLADGPAIAPETARRIACDASVVTLIERGGEPLGVGRKTRRVSLALRRALRARDGCCRFPGCTNRHVDAHHITHWADDGKTELGNLVLLCRRHHRLVHEGGWKVDHRLRFVDPYGRPIPHRAPQPPGSVEELHVANRHLEIDAATLDTGYGDRMDMGLAVAHLLNVVGDPYHDAADDDARRLSRAIVAWTGWGRSFEPSRRAGPTRLRIRFGADQARLLRRRVTRLEREFYSSGPAAFRAAHPHLSRAAFDALNWCFQFDSRLRATRRRR